MQMQPFTVLFPNFTQYGPPPCASADPDSFFPEMGRTTAEMKSDLFAVKMAKKVCGGCSYREQCLKWALDNDERFGIWGGLTVKERLRLRRASGEKVTRRF